MDEETYKPTVVYLLSQYGKVREDSENLFQSSSVYYLQNRIRELGKNDLVFVPLMGKNRIGYFESLVTISGLNPDVRVVLYNNGDGLSFPSSEKLPVNFNHERIFLYSKDYGDDEPWKLAQDIAENGIEGLEEKLSLK